MNYAAILFMCLVAMTTAKSTVNLSNLLKALIQELETESVSKALGSLDMSASTVGNNFISVSVIRDSSEIQAESTSNKPKYSFRIEEGSCDNMANLHEPTTYMWNSMMLCAPDNPDDRCHKFPGLDSATEYCVEVEVQMNDGSGYKYIDNRRDRKEFTTT